jgi:hypothetical protein
MTGQPPPSADTLDALRERVLRAGIATLAVGMPFAGALVAYQGAREGQLNVRTFAFTGHMVCIHQ